MRISIGEKRWSEEDAGDGGKRDDPDGKNDGGSDDAGVEEVGFAHG